ncbi:MAG: hypothetical protein FK730_17145 [Asgard group archaeon]|nr:hypothetical protein [Asgard group archaeon]
MVTLDRDRYLVFKILSESEKIQIADLKRNIWSLYQKLYGLDGTTEAGLFFEEYSEDKGIGLIRCNSQSLSHLMTSLAMITTVDDIEVLIHPLFISGLVNKAKKYIRSLTSS